MSLLYDLDWSIYNARAEFKQEYTCKRYLLVGAGFDFTYSIASLKEVFYTQVEIWQAYLLPILHDWLKH